MTLLRDSVAIEIPRPFTRLRVLGGDSVSLRVRCEVCPDTAPGRVARDRVVYGVPRPEEAARGSLGAFALAVRAAATAGDVAALRPVLFREFTFSWVGEQSPDAAVAAWRAEELRTVREVPALLDRGLATRDSVIWVAPPEHAENPHYNGLRLGFRRSSAGLWEWLFLIRGGG